MSCAGFVLVGGRSSRMGRNKARLPYRGATLLEHIASQVRQAAGSIWLVGPPEDYRDLPYPIIPDLYPDSGPAAGIHAALAAGLAEWNLVAACDMPGLTGAFLAELLAQARRAAGRGLVPVGPDGRLQPLCAVYHRACLPDFERALAEGRTKLIRLAAELNLPRWPVAEGSWFENLNRPAEWELIAAR